jgi:hypothetical protein
MLILSGFLQEGSIGEQGLRIGVIIFLLTYILFVSSVFETSYPTRIVELYAYPWWRLLLISLVAIGAWWSPSVGIVLAIAIFFYLNDMDILTSPFLTRKTN